MANPWEFDTPDDEEVKKPSAWETFKSNFLHGLSVVGEGAAHALPDTIGFVGDVGHSLVKMAQDPMHGSTLMDVAKTFPGIGPVSKKVGESFDKAERAYVKKAGGKMEDITPRNKTEEYLNVGSRGAADVLATGGISPRAVLSGITGGAAAKAVYDATGDERLAAVAALAGGVAPEVIKGLHSGRPVRGTDLTLNDNAPEGPKGPMQGDFATAPEAARFLTKNKMAGSHDIVAHDDGSYSVEPRNIRSSLADTISTIRDLEGGGTLSNPKTSPKGAVGPMQVMPDTARKPGFGIRPWDGKTQKDLQRVGVQYAAALNRKYNGDITKVLAAYNGGFARVDANIAKYGNNWLKHMPTETRNYVAKGMKQSPEVLQHGNDRLVEDEQPITDDQAYANKWLAPEQEPDFFESDKSLTAAEEYKQNLLKKSLYSGDELPEPPESIHLDEEPQWWSEKQKKFVPLEEGLNEPSEGIPVKIKDSNPEPGTPEFDKKYGYIHDDDIAYDEDHGYDPEEEVFDVDYDEPKSHYDYIGADDPYTKYEKQTGIKPSDMMKKAVAQTAEKHGIHPYDIAEAMYHVDHTPLESKGFHVTDVIDDVDAHYDKLFNEPPQGWEEAVAQWLDEAEQPSHKDNFYAPYKYGMDNYVSLHDYEGQTGKKIGKITKQALEEYAKDNGIHKDSVASHYFSPNGDPTIKEGVNLWRDNLAKEQMTPKEYAAWQKLPTTDPKVLKLVKKYMATETIKNLPKAPPSGFTKAAQTFVRMMKDERGFANNLPDVVHNLISEWNKGTHYLMKGPDGSPLRIYHGTPIEYEGMPSGEKNRMPKGYVLYSTDPSFASGYAKFTDHQLEDHGGNYWNRASRVFPAYVKNDPAIADFRKPADLQKAIDWYKENRGNTSEYTQKDLANGNWDLWERPEMLKDLGWKGAFLTEGNGFRPGGGRALNLMLEDHLVQSIFDPNTYKNNTAGHKLVRNLVNLMKDESGAFDYGKMLDDLWKKFGRNKETPEGRDQQGYEGLSPEEKLTKALNEAKPISRQQVRLYHEEKAVRAAKIADIQKKGAGAAGYQEQLKQLKGGMPKVDYESIAKHFTQEDIDTLLNRIQGNNWLLPYEKLTAQTSLMKLLGAEGGKVPTTSEIKLLSHIFPEELIDSLMKNRPFAEKFYAGISNALNVPRSLMASFDLSAPLRQGVFMVGRKEFYPAFAKMFKLFGSEKASKALQDEIRGRETYPLMRRAGLALTDPEGKFLDAREEQFMSSWAEKIPVIGRGVKASDRAYSGFLNKLRADTFDSLVKLSKEAGVNLEQNGKALRDIAHYINSATGRGDVGQLVAKNAPLLNGLFFSPRLMASRVTMLNPAFYVRLSPVVRKEAIKSLLAFSAIALTVLTLAKQGGATVEDDPRSADFGKIKSGDTRFDILGGFQQYIRFGAQMLTGETKTARGQVKSLTDGKFGNDTRLDVVEKFFENKFSPVASFIADFLRGKDPVGKKFDLKDEIVQRFIPLVAQDTADAIKEYGAKGLLYGLPGVFGVGVQTYKPAPAKSNKKNPWEFNLGSKTPSKKKNDWEF